MSIVLIVALGWAFCGFLSVQITWRRKAFGFLRRTFRPGSSILHPAPLVLGPLTLPAVYAYDFITGQ
ncbi:MAG TPA: hypothetical protein VK963_02660 [Candidatus Saccharimonadales bacterium]|nr:hypothetical protein [Candidatus Saccharimonadales bacterium]